MSRKRRRQQIVTGAGVGVGATLAMGGAAQAATFTVTSLAEPTDSGNLTLRQAIAESQMAGNAGSTITFASGLSGTVHLGSQLPALVQPVTIQGPGAGQIAISGEDNYRIFDMDSPGGPFAVTISGLTLTHGLGGDFTGGAIDSYNAKLTLSGVVVSDNTAGQGAGAIWAYSGLGTLTIRDSTLTGNESTGAGGGAIYAVGTPVTIQNSTFTDNHAPYRASALGIDDPSALSTIENSTFTGNTTTAYSQFSRGGAIYSYAAEHGVTVSGSTIVGNTATYGGGIFNHSDKANFPAPPVVIHNSIVANNTAQLNPASTGGPDLKGPFDSAFSLLGTTAGASVNEAVPGTDIVGHDPLLAGLAANGGATLTMKPAASSPVVDRGSAFGLTTDQRGSARPFDAPTLLNAYGSDGSDIGAVELQANEVPAAPFQALKKKKCKRHKKKHKRSAESAKKKKCKKKRKKR